MRSRQLPEGDLTVIPTSTSKHTGEQVSQASEDNILPIGTRLGDFEIIRLIGQGGFGIVYLAFDHSHLQRKVAIKEYMPSGLATRKEGMNVVKSERHLETFNAGLRSFINEAQLLAQFDHPSLVKVYDFWEANETAYMVMPFYEGSNLRDLVRQRKIKVDELWLKHLLGHLLDALEMIHGENCFHRDITPDNILILKNNRPLLLDFGAARRVISDMTQDLTVILKPGYAPIEQYAETDSMKQGAWTDIYALGAVVYFAITGKTPVVAVSRVISDSLEPLAELEIAKSHYRDEFLHAIDKALEVKPEDRPQDIAEFCALLGLSDMTVSSTRFSVTKHKITEHKNNALAIHKQPSKLKKSIYSAISGLATISIFALVIIGGWFLIREELQPTQESAGVPENEILVESDPPDKGTLLNESENTTSVTAIPESQSPISESEQISSIKPNAILPEVKPQSPLKPSIESEQETDKTNQPIGSDVKHSDARPSKDPAKEEDESVANTIKKIIASNLAEGRSCLTKKNFECAIEKAEVILEFEPDNGNAEMLLREAASGKKQAWEASELR